VATIHNAEFSKYLQQWLQERVPGPKHHPWAKWRWKTLGLYQPILKLQNFRIDITPWEHVAVGYVFGNGSPKENEMWLERDLIDLTSLPCRLLFEGVKSREEAIRMFQEKYVKKIIDPYAEAVFAEHPYHFLARWGPGLSIKIKRSHIEFLYGLLPPDIRSRTPIDYGITLTTNPQILLPSEETRQLHLSSSFFPKIF
jgi:hypothetical protein